MGNLLVPDFRLNLIQKNVQLIIKNQAWSKPRIVKKHYFIFLLTFRPCGSADTRKTKPCSWDKHWDRKLIICQGLSSQMQLLKEILILEFLFKKKRP